MTCPISGFSEPDKRPDKDELDPRAGISLARVNWLHARYNIVRFLTSLLCELPVES